MKIYTITFHWATNYGAVLQAYALQKYLTNEKHDVHIINYVPKVFKKSFLKCLLSNPKKYSKNFKEWNKEKAIESFRKKQLDLTKLYPTHKSLVMEKWGKAVYICGSDQIWNPFFTLKGEGNVTLSYYLDFVPENAKKISYAASFGVTELNKVMGKIVANELKTFSQVSVRERSAVEMLEKVGITATLVCDPVFLLSSEEWKTLLMQEECEVPKVFRYILHEPQEENEKICQYIENALGYDKQKERVLSIEEWLRTICETEMVVTNSFHAVAFSVIFHRPFVAIIKEGNGMNDRLITLLEFLGLSDRIVKECDKEKLDSLMSVSIDWALVDEKREKLKELGKNFLNLDKIAKEF